MFGGFKKLFSKEAEAPAQKPAVPPPSAPQAPRPGSPVSTPAAAAPAPAPRPKPTGETVNVPFKPILSKLPANLAALVKSPASGNFPLHVATAVTQLRTGAVRVPFGDLRAAAPAGTFADNATLDETMVDLPLADVLPLINPALLIKRTEQKKVYVSEDVTNVFGPRDKSIKPSTTAQVSGPVIGTAPVAAPAPVPAPAPVAAAPIPIPVPEAPSAPIAMPTISMAKPAAAPAPAPAPKPAAPPLAFQSAPKPAAPAPAPLPAFAPKPAAAAPAMPPSSMPRPAMAAPAGLTPPPPLTGDLMVPVAVVCDVWPEALRKEIEATGLKTANLAIPMALVEPAMRAGKIFFSWGEVSKWMSPAPVFSFPPETALEFTLKVIIPLFMAQRKTGGTQKKVAVGENIPDVFGGVNKPAAAPAPEPAPAPAPMPVAVPEAPAAPIAMPTIAMAKPAPAPAPISAPAPKVAEAGSEIFAALESAGWGPKETVEATCSLAGVAGVLISTADGLSVACHLPEELNSENVAAFLPQIFGRIGQYTKELQLGGLSSMSMVVNDATCAVFKAGSIYLVVLGKANAPLPDAVLKRIATELAKRNP